MADYPSSIYTPRTLENAPLVVFDASKTTIGYAEDANESNDEIIAIESILGLNPQGSFDTVVERLDTLEPLPQDLSTSATPTFASLVLQDSTPSFRMIDTNASEKDISLLLEASFLYLNDDAGSAGDFITYDIANNRLGINQSTPTERLDIGGQIKAQALILTGAVTSVLADSGIFDYDAGDQKARWIARGEDDTTRAGFQFIGTASDGDLIFEFLSIDGATGNIGFNVADPIERADIDGNMRVTGDDNCVVAGFKGVDNTVANVVRNNGAVQVTYTLTSPLGAPVIHQVYYQLLTNNSRHGRVITVRSVDFYYSFSGTTKSIYSNVLFKTDTAGSTTNIDNDSTQITSGFSHSMSNLPYTLAAGEALMLLLQPCCPASGSGTSGSVLIKSIKVTFDTA